MGKPQRNSNIYPSIYNTVTSTIKIPQSKTILNSIPQWWIFIQCFYNYIIPLVSLIAIGLFVVCSYSIIMLSLYSIILILLVYTSNYHIVLYNGKTNIICTTITNYHRNFIYVNYIKQNELHHYLEGKAYCIAHLNSGFKLCKLYSLPNIQDYFTRISYSNDEFIFETIKGVPIFNPNIKGIIFINPLISSMFIKLSTKQVHLNDSQIIQYL